MDLFSSFQISQFPLKLVVCPTGDPIHLLYQKFTGDVFVVQPLVSSQPRGLQHARFLCPPLSPRICSDSCPLSQWCHLTSSSSAAPFSFCLQSFPASGSFPVSRLFASDGCGIGISASILPMNIQGWFPLGLTGLISSQSKEFSRVFSSTTVWKHQFFTAQPSLWSNSHICKGQTLSPKFIFRPSALPRSFTWISVELSVSFCYVCIFCPHWVWFVLFLRTSTMIYWPLCPISFQIYSAPCVVLEPAGCLIDIFESSTPMNKACSF